MKKKRLFLIPIVFLLVFFIMLINNNKTVKIESKYLERLRSYTDVIESDKDIEGTDNVKFDAYFLIDKDGDGNADKIRGNSLSLNEVGKLNIDLSVNTGAVLKDVKISFINSNVRIAYKGAYESEISLGSIESGTNRDLKITIKPSLTNDFTSYTGTNKVKLTGTLVENGQEKEISKEVNYILDWYSAGVIANIERKYTNNVEVKDNKIIVTYNFNTYANPYNMLKSVNLTADIPALNNIYPSKVSFNRNYYNSNYNEETHRLTVARNATLHETLLINSAYDYRDGTIAFNDFEVVLEYPIEAGMKDADLHLNTSIYYEQYNNPESTPQIFTSNVANYIFTAVYKAEDAVTEVTGNGTTPYIISARTNMYSQALDKSPVYNLYDGLEANKTTEFNYDLDIQYYYSLGKVNKIIAYDSDYNNFNYDESMMNFVKYKSLRFKNNPESLFGTNGYIKMINAETNEVIHIFSVSDWNEIYTFENDVRKLYFETSEIVNGTPCKVKYNDRNQPYCNYTTALSINVIKEIDNEIIVSTYTKEQYDNFSSISSKFNTNMEAENISISYLDNEVVNVYNTDYELPKSSGVEISIDKNRILNNETVNAKIKISTGRYSTGTTRYGWKNGEFLVEFPKEIINVKISNLTFNCIGFTNDLEIDGYELKKINGLNTIKILTRNSSPINFCNFNIDADITADPRISDKNVSLNVYGLNKYYDLSDWQDLDKYDLNDNGSVKDYVNFGSTSMYILADDEIRTVTTLKIYDENNNEIQTIPPTTAEINPISDKDTAKVEIGIYNNSTESIKDIVIIGKTGYIGNTYQLRNEDLGSEFDAPMTSSGIIVPNEIIDKTTVYYSTETNPSDDINNPSNNWKTKDNVTDFNDIKSYMIIVSDYTVGVGSNVSFTYDVNIPMTTNLLYKTTYFTHAVYYNKITDNGVIAANPIEQRKTSLMITRKYNLSLTNHKSSSNSPIKGSTYLLIDEYGNTNIIKTNENGKYLLEGLYVNKEYKLVQKNVNYPFVLDEEEKKFKVINNASDQLELTNLTGSYKSSVIEDSTLKLTLENETRYDLVLKNTDIDTLELIPKSSFKITGKGYEEGKVLRTNNDGELSLKGLYLENEYTLEQISSIKHLKLIEPFKFYIKRDNNGDIAIAHNDVLKDYGIPKLFYNSTSNTFEHSIYNDGSTLYTKGSGDSEEYIELDLTGYSLNDFKIKYYSDKGPYYGSNYICIFDEIDGILDHYPNYYQACLNATYSLSNGEGYINTYYSYNENINDFEGHPLKGGQKYYIYMYMYVNWAEIRLYPIERVDGGEEKPIYTSKTNVQSDENSNIFLTIEDNENLESPRFTIDIKSKQLPTINFELTKLSADTKEPLKNAQYKIIGFGTSINGDYLKTDENGKATMVLNNTVAMKSNTRYKTIINGYDYSILGDYYSIQEVVPPIGYQIDTRKIDFRVIDKYENTNCEDSYDEQITRCEINSSTPHSYTLDTKSIINQFAEYEFDESTNTLKVTMYDYPLVSISKKDAETGELLPNTLFAVYSVSYDTNGSEILEPATDSNGNVLGIPMKINNEYVNVLSTDENGRIVAALNSGKYMAKEVQTTDEKYQIDDQIYYFTIGPTIEYDDTKLKYFGSIYSEYTTFNWYDNTQSSDGGPYTEVIPTSDGGWLVSTDNNKNYDFDNWIITIKKYDKDLNLEWESDAKPYLKRSINQYRYFDDPEKIITVDVDASLANYDWYGEARTHLSESEDGYYVNTHYIGVIKFDKNGNRLWQSRDGNINLTHYTAVCDKNTQKPVNENEFILDSDIIPYDSTNPYIQKDENTYYCSTGRVYDATLETVGGTLRWLVYSSDGTPTESRPDPKYDDTQYNTTNEFEYEYDNEGHIIGTKKVYAVQTPILAQTNNIIRGAKNDMNFFSNPGSAENGGTLFIGATPDNGVTLYIDGYYGSYNSYFILNDGTLISYEVYGATSSYRKKGNECDKFNSAYVDRSECNLSFSTGAYSRYKNLLHYSSDGKLISVDNMGRILYYAITKYNQEHPDREQLDPYLFENSYDDTEMMYSFENGDLLFLNHSVGLVRLTYNEQSKHYESVYVVPKSDLPGVFYESLLGYSMEEAQTIGNNVIIRENKGRNPGRIAYFIDENGNVSEEVTLFGENDSLNYKSRFNDSRNINGFYKLDNGNYLAYTQINKIDQWPEDGLLEDSITLGLNNQYIYKQLNLKDKHLYFIIFEVSPESKILWYKLYDITKEGSTLNEQHSPSSENYIYSPIMYNKVSNELMFIVQHEQNFPMTNVDEPSETYTADGNMLVFKLSDETRPEAPEAYSIEVLNKRKTFNINIESGENGKTEVLNENNIVYTLNNESKDIESIKYGDNSIYKIRVIPNNTHSIDKVLVNGKEYPYTASLDGSIILDNIENVKENKNIKVTFKLGGSKVIVHHYIKDTEEKIASDEILSGLITTSYETEPTLNELYSLIKDENGEYILPNNYKGKFDSNITVVTYYYEQNNVNLKVNYYKENTTIELAPSKVERKLLGSNYKTNPINIEFYELVKVVGEEEGTLNKENTEVTYMYEETFDVNLKVKYLEKDTDKVLSEEINKTLKKHDKYETEEKNIDTYRLVSKTDNYKGKAEKAEIEVIYYYEKIKSRINIKYIDKETNKDLVEPIIKIVDIKTMYETEEKNIEGYTLISNTDNISGKANDEEIEVIYYYEKVKVPETVKPSPTKIKEVFEQIEFIIKETAKVESINENKIEIIEQEEGKEEKNINSNLVVIIIMALITTLGLIIGKLQRDR